MVDVIPPNVEHKESTQYHVTLNFFWYRADGKVGSQQTYLMPWMKSMQYAKYYGDYDDVCSAGYYNDAH